MSYNTAIPAHKPKSPSREKIMAAACASLARSCGTEDRLTIDQAHAQGYLTARDCVGSDGFGGMRLNSIVNMLGRRFQDGAMERVGVHPRGFAYRPRK